MLQQTYIIVDTQNLFLRIRYGIRAPDLDSQIGLALHTIFTSIKKVWNEFNGSACVFALEGRSWRKDVYKPYKANRKITAAKRTANEVEEDKVFFEVMDEFITFLKTKTNCTVLQHQNAEADDMIARWIHLHPNDKHIIISSDSDFQQLISENTMIYNGIVGLLYTNNGVFDKDGKIAKNKNKEDLAIPNPEWLLFEKCIRGDSGDNVMSAFPGVRSKKIQEAFENRHIKGYAWNNIMLSKWVDHDGIEHRVKDCYERNRMLIDLTQIPQDLIDKFDIAIISEVQNEPKKQVGIALMRFCNQHGLVKIEKTINDYSPCLSAKYTGYLLGGENIE
jgi:5'-3' exonuclease